MNLGLFGFLGLRLASASEPPSQSQDPPSNHNRPCTFGYLRQERPSTKYSPMPNCVQENALRDS